MCAVKCWRARHGSGRSGGSARPSCRRAGCSARLTSTCARRRPPAGSARGPSWRHQMMQLRARTFVQKAVADLLGPRRLERDPAAEGLHRDHLRQPCSRERLVLAPRHVVPPATPIQQLAAVPTSAPPSAISSRHELVDALRVCPGGAAAAIWSSCLTDIANESHLTL